MSPPLFKLVKVSGSDAQSFLQGQLTQDVNALAEKPSLQAAWCNPKGRVIAVMRMLSADGAIGLVVPGSIAERVVERLKVYRLRAKVDIELAGSEWSGFAVSAAEDLGALGDHDLLPAAECNAAKSARGLVTVETGASPRCVEVYGPASAMKESGLTFLQPLADVEWQLALINAGIPFIVAETTEKYTPHMLNLDCLGAISFRKGCYMGQEVVARTEHLGRSKRRLAHYRIDDTATVGAKLRHENREVGDVVSSTGNDFLAVVPLELHGERLSINGKQASPVALPYSLQPAG
jgi:tRNA-modifying protein YgfZ